MRVIEPGDVVSRENPRPDLDLVHRSRDLSTPVTGLNRIAIHFDQRGADIGRGPERVWFSFGGASGPRRTHILINAAVRLTLIVAR